MIQDYGSLPLVECYPEQLNQVLMNVLANAIDALKPIGKGTGMGLSISYQIIVEEHGGKLEYFSTVSQGTEFVIQIPVRQSAVR